ncbi:MAG: DUF3662 domain-containing protein [Candidatus Ancillula sp.]|jgi:hypothetical protein|nr:DUF3662 domain-containing protein [Candidatus Ancillula sp.]
MGLLDRFEKGVEGAVNSVFSKIGSHELRPVDFILALNEHMDNHSTSIKNNRKVAPNSYTIFLSTPDFDRIETWDPVAFADELAQNLTEHAKAEQFELLGDVVVSFEENVQNQAGEYQINSEEVAMESPIPVDAIKPVVGQELPSALSAGVPASQAPEENADANLPYLEIEGQKYFLTKPTMVLGRGSDCDIILEDTSASRRHLELRRTPTGTIASDLQSTNGIFIEGNKTGAATLIDRNTITVGKTVMIYREAPATLNAPAPATPNVAALAEQPVAAQTPGSTPAKSSLAAMAQPTQQPVAPQQPVQQPVAQPAQQPVAQPVQQPVAQSPAQQPVAQPAQQPVMQPMTPQQPAQQPIAQPLAQQPVASQSALGSTFSSPSAPQYGNSYAPAPSPPPASPTQVPQPNPFDELNLSEPMPKQ